MAYLSKNGPDHLYRQGLFPKPAMIMGGELPCNDAGSQMLEGLC